MLTQYDDMSSRQCLCRHTWCCLLIGVIEIIINHIDASLLRPSVTVIHHQMSPNNWLLMMYVLPRLLMLIIHDDGLIIC